MNEKLPRDPATRASLRRVFANLSYEVIPLKSAEDAVLRHVPKKVRLTVAAPAGRSLDATIDLAGRLTKQGYTVAPHLAAQQISDRAELADIVARLRAAGVREVFIIGGDPAGPAGEFRDAHALLSALAELDHGFTGVGIAGNPEGHPTIPGERLLQALEDKAPFADYVTTQICFNAQATLGWSHELKRRGIDLPIHVGMPGAVTRQKLLRVSGGLGVGDSARFLKKQQSLFWRFFLPGGYSPDPLVRGLAPSIGAADNHIDRFHIFTFNDLGDTEAWRQKNLDRLAQATG
jgi:methylenetetrahydrofolate reductase (NADPH)